MAYEGCVGMNCEYTYMLVLADGWFDLWRVTEHSALAADVCSMQERHWKRAMARAVAHEIATASRGSSLKQTALLDEELQSCQHKVISFPALGGVTCFLLCLGCKIVWEMKLGPA